MAQHFNNYSLIRGCIILTEVKLNYAVYYVVVTFTYNQTSGDECCAAEHLCKVQHLIVKNISHYLTISSTNNSQIGFVFFFTTFQYCVLQCNVHTR